MAINIFRQRKPVVVEAMKPAAREASGTIVKDCSWSWSTTAPIIAGIDIRNENLPANSLSNPQKRPQAMVEPEREIPGIIARPWTVPMSKALNKPIFFLDV